MSFHFDATITISRSTVFAACEYLGISRPEYVEKYDIYTIDRSLARTLVDASTNLRMLAAQGHRLNYAQLQAILAGMAIGARMSEYIAKVVKELDQVEGLTKNQRRHRLGKASRAFSIDLC